ncbi:MAG: lipoyl synthase [Phycisphaerales bacterium]|nr:MAG: lipoyl synthase [Phycisphaerales bacterium]
MSSTAQPPRESPAPDCREVAGHAEANPRRHPRPLGGDTARFVGPATVSLSGLVLNNGAGRVQQLRLETKPEWIRARIPGGEGFRRLRQIVHKHHLHTVCQEASCPNMGECWARGTATIMILGDICTRSCGFCNVRTGKPLPPDPHEPSRVAASLGIMGLKHVVITCVDRDDLPDGGADHWAQTIRLCHQECPEMSLEALIGDFKGDAEALRTVIDARPEILSHNLETVRRMHPAVRPQADYERSLQVLSRIKNAGLISKTGIMVGIGERDEEVLQLMDDVRRYADTDILTIGQYLRPSRDHLPIDRWVRPEQFETFRVEGLKRGFRVVQSGPLVRSSYHAEEQAAHLRGKHCSGHGDLR